MAEQSKIEWCDHTFNPWEGCQKVAPECDNCYAENRDQRFTGGKHWGPKAPRRRTSPSNWAKPRKWNREHEAFFAAHGRRQRVFCASLADVFDNAVDPQWRADLFDLIRETPNLDWLLLTKRPQNMVNMLPGDWGDGWAHVWLGTSAGTQKTAEQNIPHLLATPAAIRFLSAEPLLGPVDLKSFMRYDPFHEKQAKRDVCLSSRDKRGHRDSTGWNDLETAQAGLGSVERRGGQPPMQAGESGERQRGIPTNQGNAGRKTSDGAGSSAGVASFQRPYSRRDDAEPQERHEEGQPPLQLGDCEPQGTANPCDSGAESGPRLRPARAEEQHGAPDHGTGADHSGAATSGRGSLDDSSRFRDRVSNGLEDCERGSSLNLVIVGGESGPKARPMHPEWARSLRDQCQAAGAAFFFKQWGEYAPERLALPGDLFNARRSLIVSPDGRITSGLMSYPPEAWVMHRVGKARAGRLLDGREHNDTPR